MPVVPFNNSSFDGSEVQPREIHIWEFPPSIRVLLDPEMTKKLFDRAAMTVGSSKQLAHLLGIKVCTIYGYRIRRAFIPLEFLQRLCQLAGNKFAIKHIERYIVAYRDQGSAKPILNPHLPIQETPALFALMGHLAGDGGHHAECGLYGNTQKVLVDNFIRLLQIIFGEVPVWIDVRKKGANKRKQTGFYIQFGVTLLRLLRFLYEVDFQTFTARVPARLFELPREYAATYLRALGDDEGCVTDSQYNIGTANKELMQDLYALIQMKFPEISEFAVFETVKRNSHPNWKDMYHIRFRTGAFVSYRAIIGFNHPTKREDLDRILVRRTRSWKQRSRGVTREKLLQVLRSAPMTVKDLGRKLNVIANTLHKHLGDLITWEFIRISNQGTPKMYELTEKGERFLQLPSLGLLSGSSGWTKVKILKSLVGGGLTTKEIGPELNLKSDAIRRNITIVQGPRNPYPGLLELGLVERSGRGVQTDPYMYRLTSEGRQVVEILKTVFPDVLGLTKD